jgi:hypothetical protein
MCGLLMWDFQRVSQVWLLWFSVLRASFFFIDVGTRLLVMDLGECYHRIHLMMFDLNAFTSFMQFDVDLQWIFGSSD